MPSNERRARRRQQQQQPQKKKSRTKCACIPDPNSFIWLCYHRHRTMRRCISFGCVSQHIFIVIVCVSRYTLFSLGVYFSGRFSRPTFFPSPLPFYSIFHIPFAFMCVCVFVSMSWGVHKNLSAYQSCFNPHHEAIRRSEVNAKLKKSTREMEGKLDTPKHVNRPQNMTKIEENSFSLRKLAAMCVHTFVYGNEPGRGSTITMKPSEWMGGPHSICPAFNDLHTTLWIIPKSLE